MSRRLGSIAMVLSLWARGALAAPVDVILEVDPSPPVLVTAFGELGGQELQEQFAGSLQSIMSGHVRVRFDPNDPQSIEFLPAASHLDLSTGTSSAQPGGTPANLAGRSTNGLTRGAVRGASFDLSSAPLAMAPAGTSQTFESDHITARFVDGSFDYSASPFSGSTALVGLSLGENLSGIDGSFTWFPEAAGDNMFITLPVQYRYQPFGSLTSDQIFFAAEVRLFASFSLDNVAPVEVAGGTFDVLGGASEPGGVTVSISDVTTPGSFTAQSIGLAGLPDGALAQALDVPDLAYSLGLLGEDLQIWELGFTGQAASFDVTLGYAEYTNPGFIREDRLVLYHYTDGAWRKEPGQFLDTLANTVKYTNPGFSPFVLAVSVPEPSSVVLAGVAALLAGMIAIKRRHSGIVLDAAAGPRAARHT